MTHESIEINTQLNQSSSSEAHAPYTPPAPPTPDPEPSPSPPPATPRYSANCRNNLSQRSNRKPLSRNAIEKRDKKGRHAKTNQPTSSVPTIRLTSVTFWCPSGRPKEFPPLPTRTPHVHLHLTDDLIRPPFTEYFVFPNVCLSQGTLVNTIGYDIVQALGLTMNQLPSLVIGLQVDGTRVEITQYVNISFRLSSEVDSIHPQIYHEPFMVINGSGYPLIGQQFIYDAHISTSSFADDYSSMPQSAYQSPEVFAPYRESHPGFFSLIEHGMIDLERLRILSWPENVRFTSPQYVSTDPSEEPAQALTDTFSQFHV